MKKLALKFLLTLTLCGAAGLSWAMAEGFYLGVMLGPASNSEAGSGKTLTAQIQDSPACQNGPLPVVNGVTVFTTGPFNLCTTQVEPRSQQFGTRIFVGNQFNEFAAIELGATYYSQIHYKPLFPDVQLVGTPSTRIRGLDLSLKGMLPIWRLNVFGRIGVAMTLITTSTALNPSYKLVYLKPVTDPPILVPQLGESKHSSKFSGTAGFGFSFDINQNWQTEVSANALFVGGNVGHINFYALGISYHFVNKYCGQFLCDD